MERSLANLVGVFLAGLRAREAASSSAVGSLVDSDLVPYSSSISAEESDDEVCTAALRNTIAQTLETLVVETEYTLKYEATRDRLATHFALSSRPPLERSQSNLCLFDLMYNVEDKPPSFALRRISSWTAGVTNSPDVQAHGESLVFSAPQNSFLSTNSVVNVGFEVREREAELSSQAAEEINKRMALELTHSGLRTLHDGSEVRERDVELNAQEAEEINKRMPLTLTQAGLVSVEAEADSDPAALVGIVHAADSSLASAQSLGLGAEFVVESTEPVVLIGDGIAVHMESDASVSSADEAESDCLIVSDNATANPAPSDAVRIEPSSPLASTSPPSQLTLPACHVPLTRLPQTVLDEAESVLPLPPKKKQTGRAAKAAQESHKGAQSSSKRKSASARQMSLKARRESSQLSSAPAADVDSSSLSDMSKISADETDKPSQTRAARRRLQRKRARTRRRESKESDSEETHTTDRSHSKAPKKKRVRLAVASSDDKGETDDDVESDTQSSRRAARPRPKGSVETRAREYMMAHPDGIFVEAEFVVTEATGDKSAKKSKNSATSSQTRPKSGVPTVLVPPADAADQQRPPKAKRVIAKLVAAFVATTDATLLFPQFQHRERLQIVRILLPLAYSGVRDVVPLLRLFQQNGRGDDDPLVLLSCSLRPELIDTRFCTQASSAHLTIFNYLVPLFMQRWGLMAAGVAASSQWRAVGQKYTNWNDYGRWPELLIASPAAVAEFARIIFSQDSSAVASKFQSLLAQQFVTDTGSLDRWCYIRRCSKVVNTDVSGKSLYMDFIVPPLAVWLRQSAPTAIAKALTRADEAALPSVMGERVTYPSLLVYQSALNAITKLLAEAHSSVAFGRLVAKSLGQPLREQQTTGQWLSYTGTENSVETAVRYLQENPPSEVQVSLKTTSSPPTLTVCTRWPNNEEGTADALRFDLSVDNWAELRDALNRYAPAPSGGAEPTVTAAGVSVESTLLEAVGDAANDESSSTSAAPPPPSEAVDTAVPSPIIVESCVQWDSSCRTLEITGVHGRLLEEPIRLILAGAGEIQGLEFDEDGGKITVTYARPVAVRAALLGIYGTSTRSTSIRAIATSSTTSTEDGGANAMRTFSFGGDSNDICLASTLLLARPPPSTYVDSLPQAFTSILELVEQQRELLSVEMDTNATVADAGRRLVAFADEPYDFYGQRFEYATLFSDASSCDRPALLFCLREVVLEHLRLHPADVVHVTPPAWLDIARPLDDALAPSALFDVDGTELNVSSCRVLFVPTFINDRPVLACVAFPQALDNLHTSLTPAFIVLIGSVLTPAVVQKLLVHLAFRLEKLLQTHCALVRAPIAVVKLPRIDESLKGEALFTTILQLAHAARTLLLLTSTAVLFIYESLSLRTEFFTDEDLLTTFRTTLRNLVQDDTANPRLSADISSSRTQALVDWRALAAVATRCEPLGWSKVTRDAAYTKYAVQRYYRALNQPEWSSFKANVSQKAVKGAYELINFELQQYGKSALRAFCARLHQLFQHGFRVLGGGGTTIALCRRSTEHVNFSLHDFTLSRDGAQYSHEQEVIRQMIGWGTIPCWEG